MKTYEAGAGTHGGRPFLKSVKDIIWRVFDRERELMSLRNAVGMMSEARRCDAEEYHAMLAARRDAIDTNKMLMQEWIRIAQDEHLQPRDRLQRLVSRMQQHGA